jgi:copper chaperone
MTVEFTLPDMTCGHCVKSVTAAVLRVDPAARVTADLPCHQVRIETSRSAQDVATALADEGYPPAP